MVFGRVGAGPLILGTALTHLLGLGGAVLGARLQARLATRGQEFYAPFPPVNPRMWTRMSGGVGERRG